MQTSEGKRQIEMSYLTPLTGSDFRPPEITASGKRISFYRFEAEIFWAECEFKKWVVCIELKKRLRKKSTRAERLRHYHTMYVCARTKEAAAASAKRNTFLQGPVICTRVRLASPSDLECIHHSLVEPMRLVAK